MFSEILIAALFLVNYGYAESGPNPLTIIGGNDTGIERYKFLVSVQRNGTYCVGSVISPSFVITVAHCVHGFNADDIRVRVGSQSPAGIQSGLLFNISQPIFEHPYYNHTTKVNDISLLHLAVALYYNNSKTAIPLPEKGMKYGTAPKVIGFGEIWNGTEIIYTKKLKEGDLSIKPNNKCETLYGIQLVSQICAAHYNLELSDCDEGSPVVYDNKLIGIVSRIDEKKFRTKLTILVLVADYLDFIEQIMGQYP